jgi:hypothetical protein
MKLDSQIISLMLIDLDIENKLEEEQLEQLFFRTNATAGKTNYVS